MKYMTTLIGKYLFIYIVLRANFAQKLNDFIILLIANLHIIFINIYSIVLVFKIYNNIFLILLIMNFSLIKIYKITKVLGIIFYSDTSKKLFNIMTFFLTSFLNYYMNSCFSSIIFLFLKLYLLSNIHYIFLKLFLVEFVFIIRL